MQSNLGRCKTLFAAEAQLRLHSAAPCRELRRKTRQVSHRQIKIERRSRLRQLSDVA
jgi:hypothetical protein